MPEYNATVIEKEVLSDFLMVLKVKPDYEIPDFEPGQFTVLGLFAKEQCAPQASQCKTFDNPEKLIRKAYSVASAPKQKDLVEFYIALVPEGELTPRLFNLKKNDRLFIGKKFSGKFVLNDIPPNANLILVGTGTGLAPYISMIRNGLLENKNRKVILIHGARYLEDAGYYDELDQLSQDNPNLIYIPTLSRLTDNQEWNGHRGRVTNIINDDVIKSISDLELTPENFHVFLCGNPAMIEEVIGTLEANGFRKDQPKEKGTIHVEEYW